MSNRTSAPPVVLIAAAQERSLASVLERSKYAVVQVRTGALALEWARDVRPDAIILESQLSDMSGIDACRLLHSDVRIAHNVPILILASEKPTPEQRVTALRAGAWDVLPPPGELEEFVLKLQTYVQAKRNIDVAFAEGPVDPTTGLHSRPGLARRARELGALMSRTHGALACVVFALETDVADAVTAGNLVARTARLSDIVGALGPTEFAVLAPATDHTGAVMLAQRIVDALGAANGAKAGLRAGYDAVTNLAYAPVDPVELLTHASEAVRTGASEPGTPWLRRFAREPAPQDAQRAPRASPAAGMLLENRRTNR